MRGRPPTAPSEVTERQREVARLVADGLTNEQIAERMEISLAGAKYHVSELLGRLGLQRREEIAEWYAREHGGPWRQRLRAAVGLPTAALVGGVATATGVVIFVVAFVLALDSGGGATEAPDAMSGYRAYTAEELVDLGFVDLGRLLVTVGAIESSIRHDLVAVRLPGPAELLMESGGIGWQEAGCCSPLNLASETAAHSYHLTVWPLPERTALARSVSSANGRIVWEVTVEGIGAAEHPSLAIEVQTARTRPDKLPVVIDERGHLFVRAETASRSVAVEAETGERLDLSRARAVGSLHGGTGDGVWGDTWCREPEPCMASYAGPDLLAPADGVTTCTDDRVIDLDLGEIILHLRPVVRTTPPLDICAGGPRPVSTGDVLIELREAVPLRNDITGSVTASTRGGAPLDVAITRNGTIYVGDIDIREACPCRGRR